MLKVAVLLQKGRKDSRNFNDTSSTLQLWYEISTQVQF